MTCAIRIGVLPSQELAQVILVSSNLVRKTWSDLVGGTGIEPVASSVSGKSGVLLAVA
jgi:hypothetical protein